MKKIIFTREVGNLRCDEPSCGHRLTGQTWGKHLLGTPCPKCGSNMLTLRDYEAMEKMLVAIKWANRILGPIFGRHEPPPDQQAHRVHVHNDVWTITPPANEGK